MSNHQPQTPTLTVGIAGGGAIFRNHLEAYRALPDVEVVALCDIDAERAAAVATEHGIPQSFGSASEPR